MHFFKKTIEEVVLKNEGFQFKKLFTLEER